MIHLTKGFLNLAIYSNAPRIKVIVLSTPTIPLAALPISVDYVFCTGLTTYFTVITGDEEARVSEQLTVTVEIRTQTIAVN